MSLEKCAPTERDSTRESDSRLFLSLEMFEHIHRTMILPYQDDQRPKHGMLNLGRQ